VKVLLIEPPKWVWDLMGDCVSPPLGLAQLAAVLEEERIPVELVDCNALELGWRGTAEVIRRAEPTLVGTTVLTPYFPQAIHTARIAKEVDPDIITVLGGPHVTFTAQETLRGHPEVDVIVRGEGERPLVALARALESGADWATVPGIAYRRHGEVIETPSPAPVDPKTLPIPAYHLLPMERYHFEFIGHPFGVVQASRGCPYRCTFCSEWPFWGAGWRARDPESIVEELELLVRKYGCTGVWFADDCFNVSGDHMQAICEGILKRNLRLNWFYQGRADYLVRYGELLPLMRRVGNRMVQIGIEASTDEELRALNKRLGVEQVQQAVQLLRANDIVCQGLFILGTPTDSGRSIQHKVRFAKRLDIDFPVFTLYTPFPGTGVYEQARAEGLLPDPPDYAHFDMAHALLPTEHLSVGELRSWYGWAVTSTYLDPVKLLCGLFSHSDWKRQIWWLMMAYSLKKTLQAYF